MPSAPLIELAQVGEQSVHRCIEVRRLLRDLLAEPFELSIHDDAIAETSDIHDRVQASNHMKLRSSRRQLSRSQSIASFIARAHPAMQAWHTSVDVVGGIPVWRGRRYKTTGTHHPACDQREPEDSSATDALLTAHRLARSPLRSYLDFPLGVDESDTVVQR
jgi:hypothetical protein